MLHIRDQAVLAEMTSLAEALVWFLVSERTRMSTHKCVHDQSFLAQSV